MSLKVQWLLILKAASKSRLRKQLILSLIMAVRFDYTWDRIARRYQLLSDEIYRWMTLNCHQIKNNSVINEKGSENTIGHSQSAKQLYFSYNNYWCLTLSSVPFHTLGQWNDGGALGGDWTESWLFANWEWQPKFHCFFWISSRLSSSLPTMLKDSLVLSIWIA